MPAFFFNIYIKFDTSVDKNFKLKEVHVKQEIYIPWELGLIIVPVDPGMMFLDLEKLRKCFPFKLAMDKSLGIAMGGFSILSVSQLHPRSRLRSQLGLKNQHPFLSLMEIGFLRPTQPTPTPNILELYSLFFFI